MRKFLKSLVGGSVLTALIVGPVRPFYMNAPPVATTAVMFIITVAVAAVCIFTAMLGSVSVSLGGLASVLLASAFVSIDVGYAVPTVISLTVGALFIGTLIVVSVIAIR